MKRRITQNLSLLLAAILQIVPLVRAAMPVAQSLAPSAWAIIFRWGAGAVAMFGSHAISKASSIAISPPNATVGTPYIGTVTYSGSHAGSVSSMKITNNCLGSAQFLAPGLTVIYAGGNKATVSGTPTTAGNFPFQIKAYNASTCGSGFADPRNTTLIIGTSGGGGVGPSFSAAPENGLAQVGSDATLSAGASGNPIPQYYWKQGITPIPGATNSTLLFTNIQLASAGLYTVTASNATSTASTFAYLSVCSTPSSLALSFTNYVAVSNTVVMSSILTNTPSGSNVYKWQYNYVDITAYSTNGNNFTLNASLATAGRSGTYSVILNGVVGATTVVNQQQYDSFWAFGVKPAIVTSPQPTNVATGANVTLAAAATVQQNPYGNNLVVGFNWYKNGTTLVSSQASPGTNQSGNLSLPSVSLANAGSYTVVVTNFWGSTTSAPAILTVTSPSAPPSQLNAQFTAPSGPFVLNFTNTPGANFTVCCTTNLALPLSSWTPLGAPTETSSGQYQFIDSGAQTNVQRYYSVRSP